MPKKSFEDEIGYDLGWRKKEISSLYLFALQNKENKVLLKTFILLIYSHWEGYIKKSTSLYLNEISARKIELNLLQNNFKSIYFRSDIKKCIDRVNSFSIRDQLDFFDAYDQDRLFFNMSKGVIDTQSNLGEGVLRQIYTISGLNYADALSMKKVFIDNNLLRPRNIVAHGDVFCDPKDIELYMSTKFLKESKDIMLAILDFHQKQLLEYLRHEFFLKVNEDKKNDYDVSADQSLRKLFQDLEILQE